MVAEKRSLESAESWKEAPVIILDIEGTTTSISFVKETLFPYVTANVEKYVKEKWSEEEFKALYGKFLELSAKDVEDKVEGVVALNKEDETEKAQENLIANVKWQMDLDRKSGPLKELQGHIYRQGYEKGELKGHLFDDVVPALKAWKEAGKEIYIYSSGSVEAQKLLFGHTSEGSLLEHFTGFFDTEVGAKVEKESYTKIVEKVGKKAEEITFYTDSVKEAAAAKEAGVNSVLVTREGNAELSDEDRSSYVVVSRLFEENDEFVAKKIKVDDSEVSNTTNDVEMKEEESKETPAATEDDKLKVEDSIIETPVEAVKEDEKKDEQPEDAKVEEDKAEVAEVTEDKVEDSAETKEKEEVVAAADEGKEDEKPEEEKTEVAEDEAKKEEKVHENGVNGTSGEAHTNGVEKTNGTVTEAAETKEVKEASPVKKTVIDADGDAPEAEVTAE